MMPQIQNAIENAEQHADEIAREKQAREKLESILREVGTPDEMIQEFVDLIHRAFTNR